MDGKENEGNKLLFFLDVNRPTNFVCYCDKLFLAVLRRLFHRKTIVLLGVFTERMGRTGGACTGHEDHPTCALGRSIPPRKLASSLPQHIWWLDLSHIRFS